MKSRFVHIISVIICYVLFVLWYLNSVLFIKFGYAHYALILATVLFVFMVSRFILNCKVALWITSALITIPILTLLGLAIFQEQHPIPSLIGAAKLEMNISKIAKISNSPLRYIVKEGTLGKVSDDIEIVLAPERSTWDQAFLINGQRHRADWVIYLGRYKIHNVE
jgi:hypothetical protein